MEWSACGLPSGHSLPAVSLWWVDETASFYESASFDERRAQRLIQERVNEGLRNQISRRDMHEVISGERDQLMDELRADLDTVMRNMGIAVIDVRVKKIDLPPQVSSAVYDRMNSEREIEARQYRAEARSARWRFAPMPTGRLL